MNAKELRFSAHEVDVIVHIDEALDKQSRVDMENVVERGAGVMRARFNTRRHHLMIVAYDRKRTSSAMILHNVKNQNVNAQLV